MTQKERIEAMKAKRAEKTALYDKAMCSKDADEVRQINKQLDELNEELFELEHTLPDDVESRTNVTQEQLSGMLGAGSDYTGEMRTLASFSLSDGSSTVKDTSCFLKRDETFVSKVPQSERKPLDLGKYIRGAVTGNWNGAMEERSAFTTSTMGVIIPSILSADLIDKARNVSLFTEANVPIVPMQTNNMTIARVKTDPVFKFKEELEEAEASDFELDTVELKAKTAYGYAYISLEAIKSAANLTEITNRVFTQAIANMIDMGMLYGSGY